MVRLLDELLPLAAKAQTSGLSFDLRLYLRENRNDGKLWAEVGFLDPVTDRLLNHSTVPRPSDGFFGRIAEKGFPLAVEMRTEPVHD